MRIEANTRALIDEAAGMLGKTRTEFMIDTARRQAIATEKDVPRLRRTAMGRVVNVFEDSRKGGASRCEFEASGLQGHGRHSNPAWCARLA